MPAHTLSWVYLAVLLVALPWLAARTHRSDALLRLPRLAIYASTLVSEWILVGLLVLVLRLEGTGLRSLGLQAPRGPGSVALTTLVLVAGSLLVGSAVWWLRRRSGTRESAALVRVLPGTRLEGWVFVALVAPTAGFAEEVVFRGFVVGRLAPLVGSPAAVLVGAVFFSLCHLYQGRLGVARVGALGVLLGAAFVATGSLLPSILAHGVLDVLGGTVLKRWLVEDGEGGPDGRPRTGVP